MYNAYGYNNYMNDLQQMRDRIDRQMQMVNQNQPQSTPITQNFQLAPNQEKQGIKFVGNIEDVKKELVFTDTLFVDKNFSTLWFKNASGEVKTYELKEVVEMDEKDRKIMELMARVKYLEEMEAKLNEQYVAKNVNGTTASPKSAISDQMAYDWVHNMKPEHEHWTLDDTTSAMRKMGYNCDRLEFYVVANMMYNDFYDVVKDNQELALSMAYLWLNDEDAKEGKLYNYYKNIPKRD